MGYMNIIPPDRLYTEDFSVKSIFSMHQHWKAGSEFSMLSHERPTNAFLYFSSGSAKYYSSRESAVPVLEAGENSLVYIPKGTKYIVKFDRESPSDTELFEFCVSDGNGDEFILGKSICNLFKDASFMKFDMQRLADAFRTPILSPSLMYSLIYGIFHTVSKNTVKKGLSENKFGIIEKSIRILETSPDNGITVRELSEISNVSVGTFNRLFYEYSGMSPGNYRNALKIERAKKLLSENFISVTETARALGFDDTGYFCRWFRKNCGMTAMQFARSRKK